MLKITTHRKPAAWTGTRAGRIVWLSLAHGSLLAAGVGVVLPLLPTTPFLLLALFAATRGKPELKQTLLDHPRYGQDLRNWTRHGSVPAQAKVLAIATMASSWSLLFCLGVSTTLLTGLAASFCLLAVWLVTRPRPPRSEPDPSTDP